MELHLDFRDYYSPIHILKEQMLNFIKQLLEKRKTKSFIISSVFLFQIQKQIQPENTDIIVIWIILYIIIVYFNDPSNSPIFVRTTMKKQ